MNKISTKALLTSIDEKNYTLDCIMTAEVVDRHGEIVDVDTLDFSTFLTNPVVLPFHEYDELPVGKVIDIRKTIGNNGVKQMECTIKFAVEEYPVAQTYWNLYKGGFMSAFSMGFMVGKVDVDASTGVTRLLNCSLLEISCVSIPANQLALAKSKGLDIDPVLETIPEKELTKAVREMVINVQTMLNMKAHEAKELDTSKTSDILEREQKRERAKLLVSKAIRLLRE